MITNRKPDNEILPCDHLWQDADTNGIVLCLHCGEARSHKPPPDPDNMNEDRAAWASACIQLMSDMTGCEPGQEALGDLVCNLFHWGDRNGITPDEMENIFASRRRMYNEETAPFEKEY